MTGKEIQTSFFRKTGEWKYRMPVLSSGLTLMNTETMSGKNPLISILIMAGVGYLSGLIMDKIEKGDPKRMEKWFKK